MKINCEYKSRFRILKGGKISLVVSGILLSASMVVPLRAAPSEWVGVSLDDDNATYTLSDDIIKTDDSDNVLGIKLTTDISDDITTVAATIDLNATDGSASGVWSENSLENSSIINKKRIELDATKNVEGFNIGGEVKGSTLNNEGEMNLHGEEAYALNFRKDINGSSVENKGTIKIKDETNVGGGLIGWQTAGNTKFINSGKIDISAERAIAIYAQKLIHSEFTNKGTISLKSLFVGAGIGGKEVSNHSVLLNSGTINIISEDKGKGLSSGIYAYSLLNGSLMRNDGSITIENLKDASKKTVGMAVSVYNDDDEKGVIDSSSIVNNGNIVLSSKNNVEIISGIYSDSNITGNSSIVNKGLIRLSAKNDIEHAGAILVDNKVLDSSSIINSGKIEGSIGNGELYGVLSDSLNGNSSIINTGTITLEETNATGITDIPLLGIGTNSMEGNTTLSNSGDISLKFSQTSVDGSAMGVGAGKASGVENIEVSNSGHITISAKSDADRSLFHLVGLGASSLNKNSKVKNSGSIVMNAKASRIDMGGISVYGNVKDNAIIENSGTIVMNADANRDVRAYGIAVMEDFTLSDNTQLKNSGTIKLDMKTAVDKSRVNLLKVNDIEGNTLVANSGTLEGKLTQGSLYGIIAEIVKDNSIISNSGNILLSQSNSNDADDEHPSLSAVNMDSLENNASVYNSGNIVLSLNDKSTQGVVYAFRIKETNELDKAQINNSGKILISAKNDAVDSKFVGVGVGVEDVLEVDSKIVNSGYIGVDIKASDTTAVGMGVQETLYDNTKLENSGIIDITTNALKDNYTVGLFVNSAEDEAEVINSGTIKVTANSAKDSNQIYGIYVMGLTDDTSIINSGNIIVQTENPEDAIAINMDKGKDTATINNSGSIVSNGYAIYSKRAKIVVSNSGLMHGAIYTPEMVVENKNGGKVELLNFTDSRIKKFKNEAGSTLQFQMDVAENRAIVPSKLQAKEIVIADNSTLDFKVNSTFIGAISDDATVENIITAQGSFDMNTSAVNTTDNSLLVDFTLEKNGDNLNTVVHRNSISSVVAGLGGSNAVSAGRALDDAMATATGTMRTYLDKLVTLPTAEAMNRAIKEITPIGASAGSQAAMNSGASMSALVQNRQSSVSGLSSGDLSFSDRNIWFKPFGSRTKQDNYNNKNGFTANTYGFGFGFDGEYATKKRVGISFMYSKSDVDVNDVAQNSDINSFTLMGYGNQPLIDDKTTLSYQVAYTRQNIESTRTITTVPVTASADYSMKSYLASVNVARLYQYNNKFSFTPSVKSTYQYLSAPSYSESGAGNLGLNVNGFHDSSFIVGLGSNINYSIARDMNFNVDISLDYDFTNDGTTINSSFEGGNVVFATKGIENKPLIYNLGAGFSKQLRKNLSFDLKYNFSGRGGDYKNHSAYATFTYKL
jgi:uncharacterized protein with beta-barrel porin domain